MVEDPRNALPRQRGGNVIEIVCETAIDKYADLVYRIAAARTENLQDAEDIFQDVFLQLFRHKDKLQSEEHLKYWLIRTTINRTKNYHLAFWKRQVDLGDPAFAEAAALSPEEQSVIRSVRDAIRALPQKLRSTVYLYYYEEYSVEEIAGILGVPSGTVKSRLYQARKILKPKLEEEL